MDRIWARKGVEAGRLHGGYSDRVSCGRGLEQQYGMPQGPTNMPGISDNAVEGCGQGDEDPGPGNGETVIFSS